MPGGAAAPKKCACVLRAAAAVPCAATAERASSCAWDSAGPAHANPLTWARAERRSDEGTAARPRRARTASAGRRAGRLKASSAGPGLTEAARARANRNEPALHCWPQRQQCRTMPSLQAFTRTPFQSPSPKTLSELVNATPPCLPGVHDWLCLAQYTTKSSKHSPARQSRSILPTKAANRDCRDLDTFHMVGFHDHKG